MRRWDTATSARRCTARATAGRASKRSLRPGTRRIPKAPTTPTRWAARFPGAWSRSGCWRERAARSGRVGTLPGGLFRSGDGGASWHLVRSLWDRPERKQWFGGGYDFPGIHSITVDPRDPRRVLAGVSCGGAWLTEDGGESWSVASRGMFAAYTPPEQAENPVIQDPHRSVRCAGSPDVLWAQHHNGVFRSTDGAKSWKEIKINPSSFGFAVAVHPRDPDTAWFVPAIKDELRVPVEGALVVTRTRDGGKSFERLRSGLPPTARLSPRLPPRPGGGGRRPDAGDGLHHRRALALSR